MSSAYDVRLAFWVYGDISSNLMGAGFNDVNRRRWANDAAYAWQTDSSAAMDAASVPRVNVVDDLAVTVVVDVDVDVDVVASSLLLLWTKIMIAEFMWQF